MRACRRAGSIAAMAVVKSAGRPADFSRSLRSRTRHKGYMPSPAKVAESWIRCQMRPTRMRWIGSNWSATTRAPKAAAVGIWVSLVPLSHPCCSVRARPAEPWPGPGEEATRPRGRS